MRLQQYKDLQSQFCSVNYTVFTRVFTNFDQNKHVLWWQDAEVVEIMKVEVNKEMSTSLPFIPMLCLEQKK